MVKSPNPVAATTELGHGVIAVDTDYIRPIFDASHLIVEDGRAAFIDTGTNQSVPLLLDALRQRNIDVGQVDFVFLTHIHLDHAGGAGKLLQHLPNARAVIHPRGAAHMKDPWKLIQGTIAVYGEQHFRDIYEDVTPIPDARIIVAGDLQEFSLAGRTLECFFTEGHARHHYCIWDPRSAGVFTGDSFGVSYRELDTANGEFIFPSSTPIDFDPPEAHKSVDRIVAYEPDQLYLTHYSRVFNQPRLADDLHDGIAFLERLAVTAAKEKDRRAAISEGMFEYLFERLQRHGYSGDADRVRAVFDIDIKINTMGLEVWLDRAAKQ